MIKAICDGCGKETNTVWGTFDYAPGGGRHGVESFHFCFNCVFVFRDVIVSLVKEEKNGR